MRSTIHSKGRSPSTNTFFAFALLILLIVQSFPLSSAAPPPFTPDKLEPTQCETTPLISRRFPLNIVMAQDVADRYATVAVENRLFEFFQAIRRGLFASATRQSYSWFLPPIQDCYTLDTVLPVPTNNGVYLAICRRTVANDDTSSSLGEGADPQPMFESNKRTCSTEDTAVAAPLGILRLTDDELAKLFGKQDLVLLNTVFAHILPFVQSVYCPAVDGPMCKGDERTEVCGDGIRNLASATLEACDISNLHEHYPSLAFDNSYSPRACNTDCTINPSLSFTKGVVIEGDGPSYFSLTNKAVCTKCGEYSIAKKSACQITQNGVTTTRQSAYCTTFMDVPGLNPQDLFTEICFGTQHCPRDVIERARLVCYPYDKRTQAPSQYSQWLSCTAPEAYSKTLYPGTSFTSMSQQNTIQLESLPCTPGGYQRATSALCVDPLTNTKLGGSFCAKFFGTGFTTFSAGGFSFSAPDHFLLPTSQPACGYMAYTTFKNTPPPALASLNIADFLNNPASNRADVSDFTTYLLPAESLSFESCHDIYYNKFACISYDIANAKFVMAEPDSLGIGGALQCPDRPNFVPQSQQTVHNPRCVYSWECELSSGVYGPCDLRQCLSAINMMGNAQGASCPLSVVPTPTCRGVSPFQLTPETFEDEFCKEQPGTIQCETANVEAQCFTWYCQDTSSNWGPCSTSIIGKCTLAPEMTCGTGTWTAKKCVRLDPGSFPPASGQPPTSVVLPELCASVDLPTCSVSCPAVPEWRCSVAPSSHAASDLVPFGMDSNLENRVKTTAACAAKPYIPNFCGTVEFAVTARCFIDGQEQSDASACSDIPSIAPTVTHTYTDGCHYRCLDPEGNDIGDCSENGFDVLSVKNQLPCGDSSLTCDFSTLPAITIGCYHRHVAGLGPEGAKPAFAATSMADCTHISNTQSVVDFSVAFSEEVRTCFKITADSSIYTGNLDFYAKKFGELAKPLGSQCSFTRQCKFGFYGVNKFTFPTTTIQGNNQLLSQTFSSQNCDATFDCQRSDASFCGHVQRTDQYVLSKDGNVVATLGATFAATGLTPMEQKFKLLLGPRIPASVVTFTPPTDIACSSFSSSCYNKRCAVGLIASAPQFSDYSEAKCDPDFIKAECSSKFNGCQSTSGVVGTGWVSSHTGQFCTIDLLPGSEKIRIDPGCPASPSLASNKDCVSYQSCTFVEQTCRWVSTVTNQLLTPLPSAALCSSVKAAIAQGKPPCLDQQVCGTAKLEVQCLVKRTVIGQDPTFLTIPGEICDSTYSSNGYAPQPPYTPIPATSCDNTAGCEATWVCSLPTTGSIEDILAEAESNPVAAFSSTSGILRSDYCETDLSPSRCQFTSCGSAQLKRAVGCLRRTEQVNPQDPVSYEFSTDANTCGMSTVAPYQALPCSGSQCQYDLNCSFGGSAFSSNQCRVEFMGCPYLPNRAGCDATSTSSQFVWENDRQCISPLTGARVHASQCTTNKLIPGGSLIAQDTQLCTYIPTSTDSVPGDFCEENLRMPVDFTLDALLTDCQGGFSADDDVQSQLKALAKPSSIALKFGKDCTPVVFKDVFLETASNGFGYIRLDANTNSITRASKLRFLFSFTSPAILSLPPSTPVIIYLFSTASDDNNNTPYVAHVSTTLAISSTTFSIPPTIPPGQYNVVFYLGKVTYRVLSFPITLTAPAPSTLSTTHTPHLNSTKSPKITIAQANTTTPEPNCWNGQWDDSKSECDCLPGFSGTWCTKYDYCDTSTSSTSCHPSQAIAVPTNIADTKFTLYANDAARPKIPCTKCMCLGHYDPADGCNTCSLQCGKGGKPNKDCTQCECDPFYSGAQCECYSTQFSFAYNLPPPIISQLYSRGVSDFTTIEEPEATKLAQWKRLLLTDLSVDLSIPIDLLSIVAFGSHDHDFIVIYSMTQCAPYPTSSIIQPLTSDQISTGQAESVAAGIAQFRVQFNDMMAITQHLPPPTVTTSKPTFTLANLQQRQDAFALPSDIDFARCSRTCQAAVAPLNDLSTQNINFSLLQSALPIPTSINNTLSNFYYSHPAIVAGPGADSTGGFYSLGAIHNAPDCQTGDAQCPSPPDLSNSSPSSRPTAKGPGASLPPGALVGIIVGIIFLFILLVVVLCSCSWIKQIWCFKDYRKKRQAEEDAAKQARKSKSKKSKPSTELSSPTSPKSALSLAAPSHTADLTPVPLDTDEKELPKGWTKMQHRETGKIIFVNELELKSQEHHPLSAPTKTSEF